MLVLTVLFFIKEHLYYSLWIRSCTSPLILSQNGPSGNFWWPKMDLRALCQLEEVLLKRQECMDGQVAQLQLFAAKLGQWTTSRPTPSPPAPFLPPVPLFCQRPGRLLRQPPEGLRCWPPVALSYSESKSVVSELLSALQLNCCLSRRRWRRQKHEGRAEEGTDK